MYDRVYLIINDENNDIEGIYLNEHRAYSDCMEYNLEQLTEFEKYIKSEPCIKQTSKSIIQELNKINDKEKQLNYYIKNISEIYDYFYDGSCEQ